MAVIFPFPVITKLEINDSFAVKKFDTVWSIFIYFPRDNSNILLLNRLVPPGNDISVLKKYYSLLDTSSIMTKSPVQ